MKKEFVMRGKTPSDNEEILHFSGFKPGMAFRMTEFQLYPSSAIGTANAELVGSVTAAKTAEDPENPDFTNEGLVATCLYDSNGRGNFIDNSVVNDTFLITQDLILKVKDTVPGAPMDVNWQCRFESVKMSGPEEAVTNYKQFLISDTN